MKKKKLTTKQLTILGLMIAVLLLMAYTPLGYLNIGPLAITFNMIPVAIGAISCGPLGGAILGAVFGLTSFGQCIGVGGVSAMGAMLFSINPVLAFIQRFVPRFLDGLLLGYIFKVFVKQQKYDTLWVSYRFLVSIFEYIVLYDSTCCIIWQYRICAELNWRT